MVNGSQMTLDEFMPEISQRQIVGASDSHAKISVSQESSLDFKATAQACFSELCTLSDNSKKKINPLTFSLRTLRICLALMEDGISPDCSLKWIGGGYDAEWQVLNSKDFGVPQNRERCFIIGHLRGRSSAKVFPVEGTDGENRISIIAHKGGYRRNTQVFDPDGITETLDTGQGGGRGHHTAIKILNKDYRHAHEAVHDINGGGVGTLMARDYKGAKRVAIPVLDPGRADKRQNGRRFKEDGEPMFTLTGQDRHGVVVGLLGCIDPQGRKLKKVDPKDHVPTLRSQAHGNEPKVISGVNVTYDKPGMFVQISDGLIVYAVWYEKYQCYIAIRKLTPRECFRLQGWADEYFEKAQFVNSDSQLYKQAGNGVTVSVIKAMAEKMNADQK